MERILSTLTLLLFSLSMSFGQEGQLILTHKSKDKERAIATGTKLKAYKSEYFYLKGELSLVDSTSIAVGKDTVLLSDLQSIEVQSPDNGAGGILVAIVGTLIAAGGIAVLSESGDGTWTFPGIGIGMIAAGGVMTVMGLSKAIIGKVYKERSWTYRIQFSPHEHDM